MAMPLMAPSLIQSACQEGVPQAALDYITAHTRRSRGSGGQRGQLSCGVAAGEVATGAVATGEVAAAAGSAGACQAPSSHRLRASVAVLLSMLSTRCAAQWYSYR